ncbi:MAG: 30S ribosomal protein S15 [Thermotogae bacterium]|nr:30S ribosomal protein S15 [Thermotogota bacterium]
MIFRPEKEEVAQNFMRHEKDTGSPEVQIALLTARIKHLTEHVKRHRKDVHTRYGLLKLVERRKKLMRYLKRTDYRSYVRVIKTLGLRDVK